MGLIVCAITFMILAILVKHRRMHFLIAGYNTMSAEEKAKYDIEKIATLFRNVMFGMAVACIAGYFISVWLNSLMAEIITLFSTVTVGAAILIIKSNSKKYRIGE